MTKGLPLSWCSTISNYFPLESLGKEGYTLLPVGEIKEVSEVHGIPLPQIKSTFGMCWGLTVGSPKIKYIGAQTLQ